MKKVFYISALFMSALIMQLLIFPTNLLAAKVDQLQGSSNGTTALDGKC